MGYLRVVVVAGAMAAVLGGCGSRGARVAAADAQVVSASCQESGVAGHTTSQSCSFVLSDGQQFRCRQAFEGQTPKARVLEHTKGCARSPSLKLSPAERGMIAALAKARRCLTAKGIGALGAPVLPPNPPGSSSADGEIVVGRSATHVVFIAFYTSTARAEQLEASLMRNAHGLNGQVERHGAVSVVWIHPAGGVRAAVRACAFA